MKAKNFLLITLDNVRYDFLTYTGNSWIKTPNFRSFANDCFQFDNHFTQIPFTPTSIYSLLYGVDPTDIEHSKLAEGLRYFWGNKIPRFFKKKGYFTAGIVSALVLRRDLCPLVQADFDMYDDFFETQIQENSSKKILLNSIWARSKLVNLLVFYARGRVFKKLFPELPVQMGDITTQKLASFIEKNRNRNWFLWVHYFDAHVASPLRQYMIDKYGKSFDDTYGYFAPPEYLHMYDEDEEVKNNYIYNNITTDRYFVDKANKYAGCVSYLDKLFGDLINFLKAQRLYDNTVIILTSDHGTPLGKYGHSSKVTNVFDCTVKVPLFIKIDGNKKRIDSLTGHSDLLSIIKDIYAENDILLDKLGRECVFFESPAGFYRTRDVKMYGMRTSSFKFIVELRRDNNKIECKHYYFDVTKDPYESNNIFDSLDEAERKELINKLEVKFQGLNKYKDLIYEFRSSTDDEAIKRRLRELGYY